MAGTRAHGGTESKAAIAGHPIHPVLIPFPNRAASRCARDGPRLLVDGRRVLGACSGLAHRCWLVDGCTCRRNRANRLLGHRPCPRAYRRLDSRPGQHNSAGGGAGELVARLDDAAAAVLPWGLTLSAINAALLGVTGWYGGELSYRHRIGVTGHGG